MRPRGFQQPIQVLQGFFALSLVRSLSPPIVLIDYRVEGRKRDMVALKQCSQPRSN